MIKIAGGGNLFGGDRQPPDRCRRPAGDQPRSTTSQNHCGERNDDDSVGEITERLVDLRQRPGNLNEHIIDRHRCHPSPLARYRAVAQ